MGYPGFEHTPSDYYRQHGAVSIAIFALAHLANQIKPEWPYPLDRFSQDLLLKLESWGETALYRNYNEAYMYSQQSGYTKVTDIGYSTSCDRDLQLSSAVTTPEGYYDYFTTAASACQCTDQVGWQTTAGYSCATGYSTTDYCTTYGSDTDANGVLPASACCMCGGGTTTCVAEGSIRNCTPVRPLQVIPRSWSWLCPACSEPHGAHPAHNLSVSSVMLWVCVVDYNSSLPVHRPSRLANHCRLQLRRPQGTAPRMIARLTDQTLMQMECYQPVHAVVGYLWWGYVCGCNAVR